MQIAVGGCLAQKDRDAVLSKAPWVDVVFGTHNIGSLPALLERARHNSVAQVEILESLQEFPSTLPAHARIRLRRLGFDLGGLQQHLHVLHRARAARQGGRPQARRHPRRGAVAGRPGRARGDPARAERQRLRRLVRRPGRCPRDRGASRTAAGLRAHRRAGAGAVHLAAPGRVHRRRHRGDGARPPTCARRCTCRCSPARTACSRRCAGPTAPSATSASSTRCARRSRTPPSPPTSSSGSPARPRRTSQATLDVVERARFASAFTFQYSKRPGTPAAELADQLPKAVVQERYQRLIELQERDLAGGERRADRHRASNCWSPPARAARTPAPRGCPGGPATAGWCTSARATRDDPARRRRHHHRHRRRPAPPDRRRRRSSTTAAPAPVTRTRRAAREDRAGQRRRPRYCPASACRPPRPASTGCGAMTPRRPQRRAGFDDFKDDIEAAERRVAREIDPGARALVVAILVFVLLLSFVLPHTGSRQGSRRAGRRRRRDPRRRSRCRRGCSSGSRWCSGSASRCWRC